jgi:spore coat protein U-like protein
MSEMLRRHRPSTGGRGWQRRAMPMALAFAVAGSASFAHAATCTMSTPGVDFGGYDVYAAGAAPGSGTLTLSCAYDPGDTGVINITYTISMSAGSSNSFVQRQMQSGGNVLGYNLYTTNGYSVVWGDGTGSTGTIAGTMKLTNGHPTDTNIRTVYGQIPALQDAAVATDYRDNVTITVTY